MVYCFSEANLASRREYRVPGLFASFEVCGKSFARLPPLRLAVAFFGESTKEVQ
jgi:hypothetical protein